MKMTDIWDFYIFYADDNISKSLKYIGNNVRLDNYNVFYNASQLI